MSRRILILSPFPPRRDGHHGGCRSTAHAIAELAENNLVRVLCFRADGEPPTEPALARLCEKVEEIRRPGASIGLERIRLTGAALSAGLPFWVGNWTLEAFRQRVRETVLEWRPDSTHFEYHIMGQYADVAGGSRKVLVQHEPGAAAARDRRLLCPAWQRLLYNREAEAWEKYERAIQPRFDAVVCYSERDMQELSAMNPAVHFAVIAPILAPDLDCPCDDSSAHGPVFFAGNFCHPPNVDAALRLAREVFPLVQARCPEARLQIAGASPSRALRTLASRKIEITGRVPDMKPLLAAAAVVAIPLRSGAGVRIKFIEALCAGKAVVATKLAAEGLDVRDGVEFVRAESDAAFAGEIAALLADGARRAALGAQGRAWGRSFCKPGRLRAAYEDLYSRLDWRAGVTGPAE